MLLLEYLVNETTMTATRQRHSLLTNNRQHLAEWPAHLLDRAIEETGTPACSGKFFQTKGTQNHWMENGKAKGGLDFERTWIWKRKRCTMGFLYLRERIGILVEKWEKRRQREDLGISKERVAGGFLCRFVFLWIRLKKWNRDLSQPLSFYTILTESRL